MNKLKNNMFVVNSEQFGNEIESTECLDTLERRQHHAYRFADEAKFPR